MSYPARAEGLVNMYIYIYIDMYVCVRGWVAKEGILFLASLKRRRGVQKTFSLSTLTRGPLKEPCPRKPARPEEKDEESQSVRVRLRSSQPGAKKQSARSMESRQSNEDDGQTSQHFGGCVGLLLCSRVSENKHFFPPSVCCVVGVFVLPVKCPHGQV